MKQLDPQLMFGLAVIASIDHRHSLVASAQLEALRRLIELARKDTS